jgi:bacillithiol biosynthesis cysteine-adding enzyme BshC
VCAQTMRVTDLPFARIPRQSPLFLNYVTNASEALQFYQRRRPTFESLGSITEARLKASVPRDEVASILSRQNSIYGSSDRTRRAIEDLRQPDSVAVLTGQQVGLFTGPVYTIYKAITAIRLAAELRSRNIKAVPVFWMESEDHDLEEVTHVRALGSEAVDFRRILFPDASESAQSVGCIELPASIEEAIDLYEDQIAPSPWGEMIASQIRSTYSPGTTLCQAFARTMAQLFSEHGLILFDPQDQASKELLAPVFRKTILEADGISDTLGRRNSKLVSSGFHTQVTLSENSTLLFLKSGEERRALTRAGSGFELKNSDITPTVEELLRISETEPERLSPNVLLRPVVQDSLFPTVAYVGGPAEIAYFAQAEVLYTRFGVPMPVIWPRSSFTLVGPEAGETMKEYNIDLERIFEGRASVLQKIVESSDKTNESTILADLQQDLERGFDELRGDFSAVDGSLVSAMETARRKVRHNLESLRAKFIKHEAERNGELLRRVDLLLDSCFPDMNLQEREVGVHALLARHGPSLLDTLYPLVSLDEFAHRAVFY